MGHKESTSRGHVRGIHISMICTLCHPGTLMFIFTCMNTYISSSHAIGRGSSEGPTMKAVDRSNMTGLLRKRERRSHAIHSQILIHHWSKNPKTQNANAETTIRIDMTSTKTHPYDPSSINNTNNDVYTIDGTPVNDFPAGNHSAATATTATSSPTVLIPPSNVPHYSEPSQVVDNSRYVSIHSRKPVMLTHCPQCGKPNVNTDVGSKTTGETWLCVVAGVVIFWPLCWVPLVVKQCKQTNHYCSNCHKKVGRVKALRS
jgi:predicted RNA-binding Zn-ribbon protein involved in translation (DUF1610 family)